MTKYATKIRYPYGVEIEEQDAVAALKQAKEIYGFAAKKVRI